MDVSTILQQVINAIQLSSAYALIAVGYTMVYGVLKLINFAHADIFMVGAYISYFVYQWLEAPFLVCLAISMAGCALIAVLIERIAYKPLRNAPRLSVLITAIGISLTLEHGTRAAIGPEYRPFPAILPKSVHEIGGVFVTEAMLWALLTAVVLVAILTYIVKYTYLEKPCAPCLTTGKPPC